MRRGFTLLEIIFAIFLAGTIISSILLLLNTNIKNSQHLLLKRGAIDLAVSRLEVETYDKTILNLDTGPYTLYVESSISTPGIRIVTVNVSWSDELKTDNKISLSRIYYEGIN